MASTSHGSIAIDPSKVEMAAIHRPGDEVIDLPAGKTVDQLEPKDYRVVEMPDVGVQMATIHRPSDEVVEFPAGKTADQLEPKDFKVVELEG